MSKPKKAGRPPKPPGELRSITIPVLVTRDEDATKNRNSKELKK